MKKILALLLVTSMVTLSIEARYGGSRGRGGYGHGGYGGRGGYGHGYGWGGAGAGVVAGAAVVGTTAIVASSANRNNQQTDPVAQAQADQMRYDQQQQYEQDQADKKRKRYSDDDYNNDDYGRYQDESGNSRSRRIQQLQQQIADIESQDTGE